MATEGEDRAAVRGDGEDAAGSMMIVGGHDGKAEFVGDYLTAARSGRGSEVIEPEPEVTATGTKFDPNWFKKVKK